MGFHLCEYCHPNGPGGKTDANFKAMEFGPSSSADVTLTFVSGRTWMFPHQGLLHYVTVHNYQPPAEFVDDVMNSEVLEGQFIQTKSIIRPTLVGYLKGPSYPKGTVPQGFVEKLLGLIDQSKIRRDSLSYRQTRSM